MLDFIATLFSMAICSNIPVQGKVVSAVYSEEKGWHGLAEVPGGYMRRYAAKEEKKKGDTVELSDLKCK